jgi:hypothetical protein
MKQVHGNTVLASGVRARKNRYIAKVGAWLVGEAPVAVSSKVNSLKTIPFGLDAANAAPSSTNSTRHRKHKNLFSSDINHSIQKAVHNSESDFEGKEDGGLVKENMANQNFAMLETYYELPIHKKQKYLRKESPRKFLVFLQELCLNAMKRTFDFDKEAVLTLNCETSYLMSISGLLATKHLRNLLSTEKMVKAIDTLIPFAMKWWRSFSLEY